MGVWWSEIAFRESAGYAQSGVEQRQGSAELCAEPALPLGEALIPDQVEPCNPEP